MYFALMVLFASVLLGLLLALAILAINRRNYAVEEQEERDYWNGCWEAQAAAREAAWVAGGGKVQRLWIVKGD